MLLKAIVLIELYDVDDFMLFCAAYLAIEELRHGEQLVRDACRGDRRHIPILDGKQAAEFITRRSILRTDQTYLHLDVGGETYRTSLSTQRQKIKTRSFKIARQVLERTIPPLM